MQKKCGKLFGSMPKIRSTRGKAVSTPSHPWRERPGQSGHYCSSIARCDCNEGSVHMKPTPLLWIGSKPFSHQRSWTLLSAPVPPPSHSLPVSSMALVAFKGGHKRRFSTFQNWPPTLRCDKYLSWSQWGSWLQRTEQYFNAFYNLLHPFHAHPLPLPKHQAQPIYSKMHLFY